MYDVHECRTCGKTFKNPASLPVCGCEKPDLCLNLTKSTGIPKQMIEKARPQVIEEKKE